MAREVDLGFIQGADGSAWHHGTSAPSSSIGKDGDWYINVATCDVYEKAAGSWGRQVNIKGAKGDPGDKGDTLFELQVDEDGNLYAVYADGGAPPKFEYESESGNLYLIVDD